MGKASQTHRKNRSRKDAEGAEGRMDALPARHPGRREAGIKLPAMLNFLKKHHEEDSDRDLLLTIIQNQHLIISQNFKLMTQAAQDLEVLVDQLTASQTSLKASLDSIKAGVATIVAGIPDGGMTADEVAALKTKLTAAVATEQSNAGEAADDANAVSAAQPAPPSDGGTNTAPQS